MIYMNKGEVNELTLNINNNSRENFTGYTFTFTHIMSKESKTYTINASNPNQFLSNIRYCEVTIDLTNDDLNYLGQYDLNIYGHYEPDIYNSGTELIFNGITILNGVNNETTPFIEYISPNEEDSNYIYTE